MNSRKKFSVVCVAISSSDTPRTAASTLAVSATYAAFGQWFEASDSLPVALGISLIVPLIFTWLVRRHLRGDGPEADVAGADGADAEP